jgi:XTP/dITP diphosphohydrolase
MAARLVLATRNAHKLREFSRLLPGVELEPLPDDIELPPETGDTFEANALIKARAAADATGAAAIADDSGVEAEALGGRPGVRSARFTGEDATDAENLDKLCADAPPGSGLRYVCVVAYVEPGEAPRTVTGTCSGRMAAEPRGDGGFGYDPVFVPDDLDDGRTMAELTDEEKDRISHRGRAVREAAAWLSAPTT